MKQKIATAIFLLGLCLATINIATMMGGTGLVSAKEFALPVWRPSHSSVAQRNLAPEIQSTCAFKPEINRATTTTPTAVVLSQINLSRFRRLGNEFNPSTGEPINIQSSSTVSSDYTPIESIALANSTNYGERFLNDLYGRPAHNSPIVVIHETVGSAGSAINTFRNRHLIESQQVSYHALIKRSGEIVYIVPPDMRAFGAGNSVFEGENGLEAVKTHPDYPPSVNNFAYHVSLETPPDGRNNRSRHSGYTKAQYQSLAWLVAKTGVSDSRITTHKAVDRSGQRNDPRSFDKQTFLRLLSSQPKTNEIVIDCQ
jgi:hypothetical protein